MTRETFKLNLVTDGLGEVIIQYDSEHSRLEITSRTKRRMVISVEKSADLEMVQLPEGES